MASDSPQDRWLFLLTVAALPLACTEDAPVDPDGSTASTTASPTTTGNDPSAGTTGLGTTTEVDGTSTSDAESGSTDPTAASSSSDGTTMPVEPGTTEGESSSTTGELGLCEAWGQTQAGCYYYYNEIYLTNYCYNYLNNYVDPACLVYAQHRIACQAYGAFCWPDCSFEYESVQQCHDDILAMQLGCDLIPVVPGAGTIDTQCANLVTQATACHATGYYIPGFSGYIQYAPQYTQYFCENGAFFTYLFPPPGVGDPCGGAYEELITCLSGLSCAELENEMFFPTVCAAQDTAVECRCNLGA
jgi:hypothetical protein